MALRLRPPAFFVATRRMCVPWTVLDRRERDISLLALTRWAGLHYVQLKLLARRDRVAVVGMVSYRPGIGNARWVMKSLCCWADCASVVLELSPSGMWGADVAQLTDFYRSLGFELNYEPYQPFHIHEDMLRQPSACSSHSG